MSELPQCDSQWNDFLVRRFDPYAMSKYDILLQWLGSMRERDVLVAGCGSGELAVRLALAGARVTAFDVNEETVALTREAARAAGVSIRTRVALLETYADDDRYDAVIATDVLEHIADDVAAAHRLVELTRPGGRIVITVPSGSWLFGYHDEILGHYRRYNRRKLTALFRDETRIERLRAYGFGLIPVVLLYSRLLRRPYPTARVGVATAERSLRGLVLRGYFALEKLVPIPVGTSLLLMAERTGR